MKSLFALSAITVSFLGHAEYLSQNQKEFFANECTNQASENPDFSYGQNIVNSFLEEFNQQEQNRGSMTKTRYYRISHWELVNKRYTDRVQYPFYIKLPYFGVCFYNPQTNAVRMIMED